MINSIASRLVGTDNTSPNLSVIIPAYNEEQCLELVVNEVVLLLDSIKMDYEILIIDDGSSDGTAIISARLAQSNKAIRVIHHEDNRGLGGVYRTGFSEAWGEVITFFPGDGEFLPFYIGHFLERANDADMILGYVPERQDSIIGRLLSQCERILLFMLFGPLAKFQGVFMIRREISDNLNLRSVGRGWSVLTELLIKVSRGNYRIISLPTETRPRLAGSSKVNNLKNIVAMLWEILRLRAMLWFEGAAKMKMRMGV